jgi:hypothetical protein
MKVETIKSLRIERELLSQVERLAIEKSPHEAKRVTAAEICRRAIREYLARHTQDRASKS